MSSSRMAWASVARRCRRRSSGKSRAPSSTRRMRSSAQKRLTAVGRVAARPLLAVSRSANKPSNVVARLARAASTTPKAAVTPIAGAPRTTRARIASATSSHRVYTRVASSRGRRVWSIRTSRSPVHRTGAIIGVWSERPARPAAQQPLEDVGVELEVGRSVGILYPAVEREAVPADRAVEPPAPHTLRAGHAPAHPEAVGAELDVDVDVHRAAPLGRRATVLGRRTALV